MKIKVGGKWLTGFLRTKLNGRWIDPKSGFIKVSGVWRKFYNDLYAAFENFEMGNIFTQGSLSVTRQASSKFSGTMGLKAVAGSAHQAKLSPSVLGDTESVYRYTAYVRPEETESITSLSGLLICSSGGSTIVDGYNIRLDPRNGLNSTSGFQIRSNAEPTSVLVWTEVAVSYGTWYVIVVTHNQKTGLIEARLETTSGVVLAELSVTNTVNKGGLFGVMCYGEASFDEVRRYRVG